MAENGLDGNISSNQVASTSRSTTILDKNVEKAHNQQDSAKSKGEEDDSNNTVPFYKLFAFADSTDVFLMIVATVATVANGVAFPLMALLMGEVVNAFGGTANNHDVVEKVSKVSLKFTYLDVGSGLASFLQVACWMITSERQAARIRNLYLKTILRQDIAFLTKKQTQEKLLGGCRVILFVFKKPWVRRNPQTSRKSWPLQASI